MITITLDNGESAITNDKRFRVAGCQFYNQGQYKLSDYQEGNSLGLCTLVREPDNVHDSNAIALYLDGVQIGHIPRQIAKGLAPVLDEGNSLLAQITDVQANYYGILNASVRILEPVCD